MKVWRLGNCQNLVGKREELVFDEFSDSEPVKRAYDGSDMTRLRSFDDSTSKRVLTFSDLENHFCCLKSVYPTYLGKKMVYYIRYVCT